MITNTHYFIDDSWYDNPCDCCEGSWMACYNIDSYHHPDFYRNGSAHSLEECWEQVLIHEGILTEDWYETRPDHSNDQYEVLKKLMIDSGLRVVIIG